MQEQLSNEEHEEMLNNPSAEELVKSSAYKGYIKIGISHEEALRLLGIKDDTLEEQSEKTGEAGYMEDIVTDESSDIRSMFFALSSYKSEAEIVEELVRLFDLPVSQIKQIISDCSNPPTTTGYSYLETLSTKDLNALHSVLARQESTGEPATIRNEIEKIVSVRYKDINHFEVIGQTILDFDTNSTITNWDSFEIDFSIPFDNRDSIVAVIKSNIVPHHGQNGIYALFDGEVPLYIGIGRPIWKRIKSHYYASKGADSAMRWVQFFSKYQKNLTVYWKTFEGHGSPVLGDRVRELVEHILQHNYPTKFSTYIHSEEDK